MDDFLQFLEEKSLVPNKAVSKGIDQEHWSAFHIMKWLRDNGFTRIGSGLYSATYSKPSVGYVIKVNMDSDPAALKFYSLISRSKSKYLPRVYKVKPYIDKNGKTLFVAVVEKLEPFFKYSKRTDVTQLFGDKLNNDAKNFFCWLQLLPKSNLGMGQIFSYEETKIRAKRWEQKNTTIATGIKFLIRQMSSFGDTDLHLGNIMIRMPQGDLVLTDPLSSKTGI